MRRFLSKPIVAEGGSFDVEAMSHGEPSLPSQFRVDDEVLVVGAVNKTWRSYKEDRGDTYLKRHWFEFMTGDNRTTVVYFDRGARRGASRWFLFTLTNAP